MLFAIAVLEVRDLKADSSCSCLRAVLTCLHSLRELHFHFSGDMKPEMESFSFLVPFADACNTGRAHRFKLDLSCRVQGGDVNVSSKCQDIVCATEELLAAVRAKVPALKASEKFCRVCLTVGFD